MVEFTDGSVIAQLSITDMRLPIQYALTYPQRLASGLRPTNFADIGKLTFQKPDLNKFPALALAIEVGKKGGTFPSVLNAANEIAVDAFLAGKIKFLDIYRIVEKVVSRHRTATKPALKEILDADQWAREAAGGVIE
jgi:1-deoxy-D-xylulose-5-phosphate reductoisomerase